jgi:DNA polymerase II
MTVRGFILHPTYRVESGRPVVHLFGRLETGESFLVRDRNLTPHFFVRAVDAERARPLGALRQRPTDLLTMGGEPVVRVEVEIPAETPPLRDALIGAGLPVYEADVRFVMRRLIDAGIRGSVTIEGTAVSGEAGASRVFDDPELTPSDWEPPTGLFRIVSIDLETDPRGERIHSAALSGGGADEVLLALPEAEVRRRLEGAAWTDVRVVPCGDEKGLLTALFARLRELDFDILTGWNVIDFDLDVLVAASRRLGAVFEVGRLPGAIRVIRDRSFWGRSQAEISGRLVLDGIDLLKGAFVKLEDYRLDTAARALLGQGKVAIEADAAPADAVEAPGVPPAAGPAKAEAIQRAFRENLPLLVRYNLADARLVLGILEKARLIELAVRRSLLTGMPLDRVGASIASFDFLYLGGLRRRKRVAPTVGAEGGQTEPTQGGAVLEPVPGLYENVLAFDFKSLYPSLIRTFNIDPLGHVRDPRPEEKDELIRAPNGACFRREPGILPDLLRDLFPRREEAKRRGDAIGSHAIKILMNSCYGVLATPACRFYSSPVANAITHFGQWVLHWARDRVSSLGYQVLYGDTDSLFVLSGLAGRDREEEARRLGIDLCARVNQDLEEVVRETWRVTSYLEFEFETLFFKLLLPSVRHGSAGARKRYAGLVRAHGLEGADEVVFVGMEVVRRDWTELSKTFQRGLYERLFRGDPAEAVAEYLKAFVADLRAGRLDRDLVYRKALRKSLDAYTATTPPHVKAARKMAEPAGNLVEYVMTTGGPEPLSAASSPIDYSHYVDKQIRPIAEQVLPYLGLSLDSILGEDRQGTLF